MSMPIETTATCQQCGETQPFTLWRSLNATLDPEAKARLLSGELTLFTCRKCGGSEEVSYPMLYHDMKARLLVWLWPSPGDPDLKAPPHAEQLEGGHFRWVATHNELLEKILVFDCGLDDRVVECYKLFLRSKSAQGTSPLDGPLYFSGAGRTETEGDILGFVHVREGRTESFVAPREDYHAVAGALSELMKAQVAPPGKWLRVDQDFARTLLEQVP